VPVLQDLISNPADPQEYKILETMTGEFGLSVTSKVKGGRNIDTLASTCYKLCA